VKIESITIKNYKSLQNITIDNIPKFSVFVGANGTGKSTLFDVFGFLRDALQNNVRQALSLRGGFKEVVARGHEKEDICFEIKPLKKNQVWSILYLDKDICIEIDALAMQLETPFKGNVFAHSHSFLSSSTYWLRGAFSSV
jgi:predicted ATPase